MYFLVWRADSWIYLASVFKSDSFHSKKEKDILCFSEKIWSEVVTTLADKKVSSSIIVTLLNYTA